jgi:hypothetical protein
VVHQERRVYEMMNQVEMTTVAAADTDVRYTNKACPGVVLESNMQDVASRLGVACVDIVRRDGPLARAPWGWQESGHGVAMRQLLLGEAVVKKLLVEDLGDDTWQNRV